MTYYQGETITLNATVKTTARALVNPTTSITITVKDPDGTTKVDAQAMSNDSTGKYHYDYAIPSDATVGEWDVEVIASSGNPSIERYTFIVEAKL
jgi:uncharacterized protein YfaS (alpha-2-macroglobulin family)